MASWRGGERHSQLQIAPEGYVAAHHVDVLTS